MEVALLHASIIGYLLTWGSSLLLWSPRAVLGQRLVPPGLCLAWLLHSAALGGRTYQAGRLPFANLYESLLIFSWGLAAVPLFIVLGRKLPAVAVVTVPSALAALLYATRQNSAIAPLPPALHSSWLAVPVSLAIVAYGAFAVAGGLGGLYIYLHSRLKRQAPLSPHLPAPETVDRLILSTVSLAFPCLVLVIITGAIWAEQAWGSYWSWDPKETWALITALVYAFFLQARLAWGWQGLRSAWLAVVGFGVVIFCYLGVNLLMSGLHSYGSR